MTYEELQERTAQILEKYDPVYIHSSPDFQYKQTKHLPVSLCVCFNRGCAWLEINESLLTDESEEMLEHFRQLCADFGIRACYDGKQRDALLKELDAENFQTAYLPDEETENEEQKKGMDMTL